MLAANHGLVIGAYQDGHDQWMVSMLTKIFRAIVFISVGWFGGANHSFAQDLSVISRLNVAETSISATGSDIAITLALSLPVPWRTRVLANPPRLVLDFREVDFGKVAAIPITTDHVKALRAGIFRPGWSRLVLELDGPYVVKLADMQTGDDQVQLNVQLSVAEAADFAAAAALPEPAAWALPKPTLTLQTTKPENGPIVVVLDPGHGGIDPGAENNGYSEAQLVLDFARQLKDLLVREGHFKVVMTRDDDVFVPLEARISVARVENADVLISLHADALEEGEAVGAVIYTLSAEAGNAAAATLAERHDRNDLLAGINLSGQDDLVATVLMDMARTETAPRTMRLATALEDAMFSAELKMHRVPLQSAGFSVLKSPDIPSVLVELGFLSSERDLARLIDKKWRTRMAGAIRDGLLIWAQEDAALEGLRRR